MQGRLARQLPTRRWRAGRFHRMLEFSSRCRARFQTIRHASPMLMIKERAAHFPQLMRERSIRSRTTRDPAARAPGARAVLRCRGFAHSPSSSRPSRKATERARQRDHSLLSKENTTSTTTTAAAALLCRGAHQGGALRCEGHAAANILLPWRSARASPLRSSAIPAVLCVGRPRGKATYLASRHRDSLRLRHHGGGTGRFDFAGGGTPLAAAFDGYID